MAARISDRYNYKSRPTKQSHFVIHEIIKHIMFKFMLKNVLKHKGRNIWLWLILKRQINMTCKNVAIMCSTVSWHHKTLMTSSNINDAVLKYSFLFGFDYFLFVFCSSGSYFSFKLSWYLAKENLVSNLGNKNLLVLHFHPDITLRAPFPHPVKDIL